MNLGFYYYFLHEVFYRECVNALSNITLSSSRHTINLVGSNKEKESECTCHSSPSRTADTISHHQHGATPLQVPIKMGKLASRASIFEQNIQKNKEAGCDNNILGLKSSTSKPIFSRNQVRKSSLVNHSSTNTGTENNNASRSTTQGARTSATNSSSGLRDRHQELRNNEKPAMNSSGRSEKIRSPFHAQDALSSSSGNLQEDLREGSISSLADHLGKLDIPSLKHRSGSGSSRRSSATRSSLVKLNGTAEQIADDPSQASIESHRNRIQLPLFRQSSYARKASVRQQQNSNNSADNNGNNSLMDDSSNQSYNVDQLCGSNTSLSSSSRRSNNNASLNGSGSNHGFVFNGSRTERIKLERGTSSRRNLNCSGDMDSSVKSPVPTKSPKKNGKVSKSNTNGKKRDEAARTTLAQHLARREGEKRGSVPSLTSWIQPSALVTDDDETCSYNSHHQKPFKSVPFAKSTIKRHNGSNNGTTTSSRRHSSIVRKQSNDSAGSMNTSSGALHRSTRDDSDSPPPPLTHLQRRSSTQQRRTSTQRSPLSPSTTRRPPAKPDSEELELQAEIEAMQREIEAASKKLMQTLQGETTDLKRIAETKERKIRRIDAGAKQQQYVASQHVDVTNSINRSAAEEAKWKEEYKQSKLLTRQLKQENARITDQNRKTKLEMLATKAENGLLEESIAEMQESLQEARVMERFSLQEHDQLVQLTSTYRKSILSMEGKIDRKDTPINRAKNIRLIYEDKMDIIVDIVQKKCKDYDLVEEVTAQAAFEDYTESEEETEDDDASSTDEERKERYTRKALYRSKLAERKADVLSSTSSHSLYIFQ